MYGMTGKLVAHTGKRPQMVEILLQAAEMVSHMPGCRLYMVNEDLANENAVWVVEIWEDRDSHDTSLKNSQVKALISAAMPLICEPPSGAEFKVVGGYGLE
jgi:quinol monooxygenase YgiN